MQNDLSVAAKKPLHFPNPIDVDNCAAMNTHEEKGIKRRFDVAERLAMQKYAAADMQAYVIALGGNPVDVVGTNDSDALTVSHAKARHGACRRAESRVP